MKVLITGSNGFIGKFIKQDFINAGHVVYGLSRFNAEIICDLTLKAPLLDSDFDMVVHCAGIAHQTHVDDLTMSNGHVLLTQNLLKALSHQTQLKSIVYMSSVAVYGLIEGVQIDEQQLPLPITAYGKSKLYTEEILNDWCNANHINLCVLRLPLVYDKNAPGNLSKMKSAINKGYFALIDGGRARKSIVHVKDIALCVMDLIDKKGIYNITDGIEHSFKAISMGISNSKRTFNIPNKLAYYLSKVGDIKGMKWPLNTYLYLQMTKTLTFNDMKARKELGWNPKNALDHE